LLLAGVNPIQMLLSPIDQFASVREGSSGVIRQFAFALICIGWLPAIALFRQKAMRLEASVGFLLLVMASLFLGQKMSFLVMGLALLCYLARVLPKRRYVVQIITAVPLAGLLGVLFVWRGVAPDMLVEELQLYIHQFWVLGKSSSALEPNIEYGQTAVEGLLAYFVPRAVWPDKPVDLFLLQSTIYPQVFGITFEQDTTVIVPGVTEAWLALGVLGCAISGAILGWFVGRIQSLAATGNLLCRTVEPLAILLIFSVNRVGILNPIVVDVLIFLLCVQHQKILCFFWFETCGCRQSFVERL
jgi:hypothetical protein